MKLLVGLGNFGEKYEKTRHNLGFMVVENFLKNFEPVKKTLWQNEEKFKSDIAQIEWQKKHGGLEKIILIKPKTYMNNSGMAVRLIVDFFKISTSDIWIMHDDIDLPLGNMKIRFGGSAAGHHGIESIMGAIGTDKFWRFRLGTGIHNPNSKIIKKDVDDFVLGKFSRGERGKIKEVVKRAVKAIEMALEEGLERAMNRFNTR